jgi:hypothetical protein
MRHESKGSGRRSQALGVVALILALLLVLCLHIGASLLFIAFPNLRLPGLAGMPFLEWFQGFGMIVAFILGLIATVTRRGRAPGIAAMVIALLDNAFLLVTLSTLFAPPGK